jgi:hypothetical protein
VTPQPILINVILDKSGSMGPKQADVIGGFNRFLDDQRKAPGRARMILTQFNTEVTPPTPAVPVQEVLPLTPDTYVPGGGTALFDAIAQTLGRADTERRPDERVLCLIVTDGEENSSRETTLAQVKALIAARTVSGEWTFAYLGVAPERWTRDTGMSSGSVAAFLRRDPGASFDQASRATRRLRASGERSTRAFFERDDSPGRDEGRSARD